MTLRDYFAGQALAGDLRQQEIRNETSNLLAGIAYLQAEAMIAERNKGEQDDA